MIDLIALENELLQPSVRKNYGRLNALLADDFWEVGASGMAFGKQTVLESLPEETEDIIFVGSDFEQKMLSDTVGMVTFTATKTTREYVRISLHCSVWAKKEKGWQMVYHQGTIAA
jgi:hypothetical protein